MRLSISGIHSLTAGYADTVGFLALKGLFTSHVTGNFVTISSAVVFGSSGTIGKVLALPVFCIAVVLVKLISLRLKSTAWPALRSLLTLQFSLLVIVATIAVWAGPFEDPDAGAALWLGMILVSAMGVQNAIHRIYLTHTPPSTVMTVTTTQIMLDLGEIISGMSAKNAEIIRPRIKTMMISVVLFATGCAVGALLFAKLQMSCFWMLPFLVALTLVIRPDNIGGKN